MASQIVAGDMYRDLDGQLSEIKRQLRQQNGYPFNPMQLKYHLQAAIEGRFIGGEIYAVDMGGTETADDIVRHLKAEGLGVNGLITSKLFPFTVRAPYADLIEIVDPGRSWHWDERTALLQAAGLSEPTAEHWLRFSRRYGKTTTGKKPYIIFPHEPVRDPDRDRRVGYVRRDPGNRRVSLSYAVGRFNDICVIAGVRRCEQPQV